MRRTRILLATLAAALVATALVGASGPTGAQTEGGGPPPPFQLTEIADSLDDPVAMTTRTGTGDVYVAERGGIVRRLDVSTTPATVYPTPVANITAFTNATGEQGLLGLTFSPNGHKLYLHHTNNAGDTRLIEFLMNGGGLGNRVVGSSRRTVLAIDQPFPNHNGGTVTFGPDNRLYLALGDGGSGGDPQNNGQNLNRRLGKILRINPNRAGQRAYTVPATNPFAGRANRRPEIWLYGVRNPWRISFDYDTGDLYVADVGQNAVEEVTVLASDGDGDDAGRGANLGWRRMEGDQPFNGATEPGNHTGPTITYDHDNGGCSVIGGHVYRSSAIPTLDGTYLYGDFCTGVLGSMTTTGGVLLTHVPDTGVSVPPFTLQSFGQDLDGKVYVLRSDGVIERVDPSTP